MYSDTSPYEVSEYCVVKLYIPSRYYIRRHSIFMFYAFRSSVIVTLQNAEQNASPLLSSEGIQIFARNWTIKMLKIYETI